MRPLATRLALAPLSLRPLQSSNSRLLPLHISRTLIAAPKPTSGPILERRPDRELPPLPQRFKLLRHLPLFAAVITISAILIFNYEKSESAVVNAVLYALRTNNEARGILGDEIYFRDRFPWIWGSLDLLHGRIEIEFAVKGTRSDGVVKFRAYRESAKGFFKTKEWSLKDREGNVLQLLSEASEPVIH